MNIYKVNNNKFKSIYISYNFTQEVNDTKIFSSYAVLASLMAKSSKSYPTQKDIEKYLNSLYGANFDVNIEKLGDLYNLEFRIEFVNKKFIPSKEELLEKILLFLKEMIYNPAQWTQDVFKREKDFILQRINERKDEKLKYGIQRAEELLCKDEPFGTYLYGEEDVVKNLSLKDIKDAYSTLINDSITVIVSGNLDGYDSIDSEIEKIFKQYDKNFNTNIENLKYNIKRQENYKYEEVKEIQDTTQSVLSLGLRIKECTPKDFYVLNVYNAILGTTPSSKLFQNVREKESLAYTVRSRYYRFKDIIVIYAGINKENYKKALDVIKIQLEDMKNGNITDIEFKSARDSLLADLIEWKDSKVAMAKMKISNLIAFKDADISIDQMREEIKNVKIEDVINISKKIEVEKVFLLGGEIDE
mgnify:FL=1